jgi:hypothetical protein
MESSAEPIPGSDFDGAPVVAIDLERAEAAQKADRGPTDS